MNSYKVQYLYWTAFNFFVRRIMATLWLLGGVFGTFWSIRVLIDSSAPINVEGIPTYDLGPKLVGVFIPLVATVFGWMFYRCPKYYPQRIKAWMEQGNHLSDDSSDAASR